MAIIKATSRNDDDELVYTAVFTGADAEELNGHIETYRTLRTSQPSWPSDDFYDMEDTAREIADMLAGAVGLDT